jgi:hypothetical protein
MLENNSEKKTFVFVGKKRADRKRKISNIMIEQYFFVFMSVMSLLSCRY